MVFQTFIFSSPYFTCFLAAEAGLLILLLFPCSYQQRRVAAHFPSRAQATLRGDTVLASVLGAAWSKGWVPEEEMQDEGNGAVFFSL